MVLRFVVPLAAFTVTGFSCDPCEDCTAEVSLISVCFTAPSEHGECACDCHAGTFTVRVMTADNKQIASDYVVLTSNDTGGCLDLEVPPCISVRVEATFLCGTPPDPLTVHSCHPDTFDSRTRAVSTGCGESNRIEFDFCSISAQARRIDSESR